MDKIKLVLADDHEVVRKGLRSVLGAEADLEVVGETGDGAELPEIVRTKRPDVIVMDFVMPHAGTSLIRQLVADYPATRVVVFSFYDNELYVVESLEKGAAAYVLKESSIEELIRAIREAAGGRRFLDTKLSQMAIEAFVQSSQREPDSYNTLTPRQKEVLQLVASGLSNAEIAKRLSISRKTVEIHRANLMRKLHLRPQYAQLIDYARDLGLLSHTHDESDISNASARNN